MDKDILLKFNIINYTSFVPQIQAPSLTLLCRLRKVILSIDKITFVNWQRDKNAKVLLRSRRWKTSIFIKFQESNFFVEFSLLHTLRMWWESKNVSRTIESYGVAKLFDAVANGEKKFHSVTKFRGWLAAGRRCRWALYHRIYGMVLAEGWGRQRVSPLEDLSLCRWRCLTL